MNRLSRDDRAKILSMLCEGMSIRAVSRIAMFYRQVVMRKGIPFDVCIPNGVTVAALKDADAGEGEVFTGDTASAFDQITSK